jgi:hypothetical protein
MEKPPMPTPERRIYPESRDELTCEIFTLLTEINTTINARKDEPNSGDEDDKYAAKQIARAVARMYVDPGQKELDLDSWQDGLNVLRQLKDQVRGVVRIEESRVDEINIEPKEARQKLFFDRLEFLIKRLDQMNCHASFRSNLSQLREQFDYSMEKEDRTAEALAWLGLKNFEIMNDKEIVFLSEMFDKQY